MRTSLFSSPPTTDTLKKDVRVLAEDTMKVARQHMVDPTVEAVNRASALARDAMHGAQHRLSKQISDAERYASRQYDRTERWVTANPFTAVGAAFVIGLVISSFFSSSKN
jgi:ElaB/YqjD/DUF883 family membrane-anchored ribosome-binding protein